MKRIYIIYICLAMLFSGCSKFLDVRPKSEKLESELFTTPKGFEDAIYGVYGSMTRTSLYGKDLLWGITEVLAQNLDGGSTDNKALAKYDYTSNATLHSRLLATWTDAYETIGYANNVLRQLQDHSSATLPLYNRYRGEMLGLRAYLHFDLLRLFAPTQPEATGIPYVMTYDQQVKPFLTVGEVYKAILADLHEAEALLGDEAKTIVYPHDNTNYYAFQNYQETHFNLYAVYGLLSRVYMTMGNKDKAAEYALRIVDGSAFPLVTETEVKDYLAGTLSPKETIFGLYSNTYQSTCESYLHYYTSYHSYSPYYNGSGTDFLMPYTKVYEQDVALTEQDYRKEGHFVEDKGYAIFRKLTNWYAIDHQPAKDRQDLTPGITLMHTSEFYLLAAEALLDTDYEHAISLYNTEVKSRGLTPLRADQALSLQRISNEFRKEMFGEGQTWYRMKRLGDDIISNAEQKTVTASNAVYVIPIPTEEYEYRQ